MRGEIVIGEGERDDAPMLYIGEKVGLGHHPNVEDVDRYPEVDIAMAADAEATLPSLIEAVKRRMTADRKRLFDDRGRKLADTRQRLLERARADATYGWDATPISTARLSAELWAQIKDTAAPADPFRILGNLYFVGSANGESYLLTSPQGQPRRKTSTPSSFPAGTRPTRCACATPWSTSPAT